MKPGVFKPYKLVREKGLISLEQEIAEQVRLGCDHLDKDHLTGDEISYCQKKKYILRQVTTQGNWVYRITWLAK